MRVGPRRAARLAALLLLPAAIGKTMAAAPIDRVEVTLAGGSPPCSPALREVVADQLADLTPDLVWVCRDRIDPEEPFRFDGARAAAIRVAIEIRASAEARLTLGDTRADRFVVRRVPLQNGLDELGREQIGQIIRFATLALRDGSSPTLSRTEARAAVASWPPPARREASTRLAPPARPQASPSPAKAAPADAAIAVELGLIGSVSAFSREIPLVPEVALGAALRPPAAHVWAWIEGGYRLPARDDAQPIGVELSAASLRLGLAGGQPRTRLLSFSGAAGIALDRIRFTPIGAAVSVQPDGPGGFWSLGGRLMLTGEWRPTSRLTIGARLSCDIAAADVHYDLRSSDGNARRVLTAPRVAPGFGVGVAWRL